MDLTNDCMEEDWGSKYYFPCCPKKITTTPLNDYYMNLKIKKTFAINDHSPKLIINKFAINKDHSTIFILCEREGDWCERLGFFPWLICEIMFENGFFIHSKVGDFFEKDEAEQGFLYQTGPG